MSLLFSLNIAPGIEALVHETPITGLLREKEIMNTRDILGSPALNENCFRKINEFNDAGSLGVLHEEALCHIIKHITATHLRHPSTHLLIPFKERVVSL